MKKIISIVLSIVLMVTSLSAITVATASSKPIFSFENKEVDAGEVVELNLTLNNNPGIAGLAISLKYDENVFTLSETRDGKMFSGFTAGKNFIWDESENVTENGTLATFVFHVSENAASADYNIDIIVRSCVNIDLEDVDCNVSSGIIKVNAKPVSVSGVSLNKDILSLMTGDSETLVANVEPADATNKAVTWESSDTSVATVDENGKVTAVKAGSATITVRTADGDFTDTCTVTVDCSHLSITVVPAEPSTCIEHGHAEYTVCNDCGAIVSGSDDELPLTDHNYVENAEAEYLVSAATCVDEAIYHVSCSVCDAVGEETFEYGDVDPTNHVGETYLVGQKDATCIETGYTGDVYCSSCDNMISAGTETPFAEHTYGEWVETTEPTCTESGEETRNCAVCGDFETRPVAATGHTAGEWTEVTAPTCTEEGLEEQRCTVCGDQIATRAIPATGHTIGEWTTTIEPTCTEDGECEAFCKECGERFTEPVPATGHTAGEWEITTPATCTEDGVRTTTCTVCGVEYTEVIPATGHQYGAWTVVKEATETEEGLRERVCSVCGEKESEVIPVLAMEEDGNTTETTTETDKNNIVNKDTSATSPRTGAETSAFVIPTVLFVSAGIAFIALSIKRKSFKN